MTKTAAESATGPDGDAIGKLRPQSNQVLEILEENRGDVVSKETLMARVWPDVHVTDDSLVQCIADIRRALGPQGAKALRTIPKKGYLLEKSAEAHPATDDKTEAPVAQRRRGILAAALALIVIAVAAVLWIGPRTPAPRDDPPVLAIMPFRNDSAEDLRYLAEGTAEDLIVALSELADLSVLSSGTTFGLMGRNIRDVADILSADYVLEGSLRVSGDELRLTAALADGGTGAAVWAEAWNGGRDDILTFQGEVLEDLTRVLSVRLSRAERTRLGVRGTQSIEAHDAYLRARELENLYTAETNRAAERQLRRALRLDPDYALAHAHMAQVMSFRVENGWTTTPEADIRAAFDHAERAKAIDPELTFARFMLGRLYTRSYAHDLPGAIDHAYAEFETALELDPNYVDAYVFLANILIFDGKAEEALPLIDEGLRRNPIPPYWYYLADGMARYFLGDHETALTSLLKARDQNPTAPFPHRFVVATYGALGETDEAEWAAFEYETLGREATIEAILTSASISNPDYLDLFADGLRKAGLPEH